jgi:poly [ADP-ribose] polymerase
MKQIVKKYDLIYCDILGNNNKFWRGICYSDGTGASEYGRVGYDAQTCTYSSWAVIEKKLLEKLKKGYTELKTIESQHSKPVVVNENLKKIAQKQILKNNSPILNDLIDRLISANIHNITSNTQITFNSTTGLFSTPLGIVTSDGILEARKLLNNIQLYVEKNDLLSDDLILLVNNYLRIIPQDIRRKKLSIKSLFPNIESVKHQSDVLDSLEASLNAITLNSTIEDNVLHVFKLDLDILPKNSEFDRLLINFEQSKKRMHGYDKIKLKRIYTIKIHDMYNNFLRNDRNIKEVYHGTSTANVLSVLKGGLKIKPPSTARLAGALFGNGIYGAIHSSKSLGYCLNRWGQGSVDGSAFLFVCDFAMGKIYETTKYGCSKPSTYDSIWAKPSSSYNYSGLKNDELIVYSENRVNIKYLLECK